MSINYELAKELKEAGFLQKDGKDYYCVVHDHYFNELPKPDCTADAISFPTLSELIKACGEDFMDIRYKRLGPSHDWWASSNYINGTFSVGGSTPEEAVARLWLALNKE